MEQILIFSPGRTGTMYLKHIFQNKGYDADYCHALLPPDPISIFSKDYTTRRMVAINRKDFFAYYTSQLLTNSSGRGLHSYLPDWEKKLVPAIATKKNLYNRGIAYRHWMDTFLDLSEQFIQPEFYWFEDLLQQDMCSITALDYDKSQLISNYHSIKDYYTKSMQDYVMKLQDDFIDALQQKNISINNFAYLKNL